MWWAAGLLRGVSWQWWAGGSTCACVLLPATVLPWMRARSDACEMDRLVRESRIWNAYQGKRVRLLPTVEDYDAYGM